LWDKVSNHQNIRISTDSKVNDITGEPGDFSVSIETKHSESPTTSEPSAQSFNGIKNIVVSSGFESQSSRLSSHLHIEGTNGIITGTQLEELMLSRTRTGLFENAQGINSTSDLSNEPAFTAAPRSVAFIQCLGSRDKNEGGLYCSRVCCSYSTRAAKVIRSYYPECEIVFFYMELQSVEAGDYYTELRKLGIEFIKCRPLKVMGGTPVTIEYDDSADGVGGIKQREFDLTVLSDGIHAASDNNRLAEICMLCQDNDGFLHTVGNNSGIFVAGCARTPMKIDEAYADSIAISGMILASTLEHKESAAYALHRR